jgi:16S rRNA (adenine1518-N6/adenine1519-N6)-dimethyltransferase
MGRRWGQHFLRSPTVLAAIVEAAALAPGEPVLEIGPGQGALTERLLATGARVTAIEVDPELLAGLVARWAGEPRLRLIGGDIMRADLSPQVLFDDLPPQDRAPYAVVANLPYYLSTPVLFRLMVHRATCSRLLLMVQREIAERLVALPEDGKAYGALSVAAHHCFTMRRVLTVPPGAFRPPPKVDSAVVHFTPRPHQLPPAEEAAFLEHMKLLFTGRRKVMLGHMQRVYAQAPPAVWAAAAPLVGRQRAEALSPAQHLAVFRAMRAAGLPTAGKAAAG